MSVEEMASYLNDISLYSANFSKKVCPKQWLESEVVE